MALSADARGVRNNRGMSSAEEVRFSIHRIKVGGVYATTVMTKVVEIAPFWKL